jgi:hypothetical protein
VEIMKNHDCCYYHCPEEGTIHIGANGGDAHWICWRHLTAGTKLAHASSQMAVDAKWKN